MRYPVILASLLFLPAAHARDWPSVPVPQEASGEWVSRDMLYNGLHMRTSRFEVKRPLAEVEAFYRKQWGAQVVRNTVKRKTVLGHAEGAFFVTVELSPSGNATRGQIGVLEIPRTRPASAPGKGFVTPPQTRVHEDIVYLDTAEKTRTLNMTNALAPYQNAAFYLRTLRAKGYAPQAGSTPCRAGSTRCIAFFSRADSRLMLSYNRTTSGSSIVAVQSP